MKKLLFLVLILGYTGVSFAQKKEVIQDSVSRDSITIHKTMKEVEKSKDSTGIYKNIKEYSEKSKVGKILHKLMFSEPDKKTGKKEEDNLPNYAPYSGRIIRDIEINTQKPFGYDVDDTTKTPNSWFQKTGNAVHTKTKPVAIEKYFLFDKGQEIDTFLINETARLLRQQKYVREVRIFPDSTTNGGDSLDLEVRTLDSWTLLPKMRINGTYTKAGIRERNFIGLGHQVNVYYSKRYADGNTGFDASYKIPNIQNTFVDVIGNYRIDLDHFYDRYISVGRKFYSTLTRWAGGAFFQERFLERPLPDQEMNFEDITMKYRYHNYWGGYAFPIFRNEQSIEKNTNLVIGLRASFLDYKRTPSEEYDPENYFSGENFYLTSIGLSSRQFVQDAFIFKDGEVEDVPIGSYYGLTTGIERKNKQNRFYIGGRASYGTYFNWGFLSANLEGGSFVNHSELEQGAISFKVNYFSNIWYLGDRWRMRQFIKPQFVIGFNRLSSKVDRVGLNETPYFRGVHNHEYIDYGNQDRYIDYKNGNIEGFDSYSLGTRKYVIDFQTQFYSPWNLLGFHINPFVNVSLAYLDGDSNDYESDKFYSSIGLGVVVRNDYLVFDSFQLSFAFYPRMPGEGSNIFRSNAYKTENFGFQSFEAEQPRPVIYE